MPLWRIAFQQNGTIRSAIYLDKKIVRHTVGIIFWMIIQKSKLWKKNWHRFTGLRDALHTEH
jgi:hypothetical protein